MRRQRIQWTKAEEQVLVQCFPTSPTRNLKALFPNRGVLGIKAKAFKLGLQKRKDAYDRVARPASVIGHLSDFDRGYLAGLIDGEGCIALTRHRATTARPVVSYHFAVKISNTSWRVAQWLQEHLPNFGAVQTRKALTPRRELMEWSTRNQQIAMVLLTEIAPYLVVKREQAELMSQGYIQLNQESRASLYDKLRQLKRDGHGELKPLP